MGGDKRVASEEELRRVLIRRVRGRFNLAVRNATAEQLLRALEAPTDTETIARLLSEAPEHPGPAADWSAALFRGAIEKARMLEEAGGALSTGEVAGLLGISVQAVQQRIRRRSLLAVPLANGEWGLPAFQLTERGVPEGLARVLVAFGEADAWVQLSVLLSDDFGGGRLIDWIREGRAVDEAVRIARGWGAQGAV